MEPYVFDFPLDGLDTVVDRHADLAVAKIVIRQRDTDDLYSFNHTVGKCLQQDFGTALRCLTIKSLVALTAAELSGCGHEEEFCR